MLTAAGLVALAIPAACSLSRYRPAAAPPDPIGQDRIVRKWIIQDGMALGRQIAAGFAVIAMRGALRRATVTSVVSYAGIGMLLVCCPLLGVQRLGSPARGALLISGVSVHSVTLSLPVPRACGRGPAGTLWNPGFTASRVPLSFVTIGP